MKLTLRQYQSDLVEKIRQSYRNKKRSPILQLSTGGGKTVIFSHIAEQIANNNKSVFILAHRQEIIKQISRTLHNFGVSHGIISPQFTATPFRKIQVASVQTLIKRLARYPEPDLIITDECHHSCSISYKKIYQHYKNSKMLGVTATPTRTDGRGLGEVFDDLIIGPDMVWLIENDFLSDYKVFAPPSGIDMEGVHMVGGDYKKDEMIERVDKKTITGCAVEHYKKICPGAPAIAFCASVKHAEHVAEAFIHAGIPARSIDGKMKEENRHQAIEELETGKIKVLTSCDIVSEGTDIPVVTAAILLRPTQSLIFHLQSCGRALRPHQSKKISYIIDHVGNCLRHGMPDDKREWSLDGIKKKASDQKDIAESIKQCDKCYAIHKSGLTSCPECGNVYQVNFREPDTVDGELKELERQNKEAEKIARKNKLRKASSLDALRELGKQMGYKPGWAEHVWNARTKKRGAA